MEKRKTIIKIISIIIMSLIIICNIETVILANENNETNDIFNDISAPNLILSETEVDHILYERNADERIYPASLTKLMTAILVVDNCELDEVVTVSENAVTSVPSGYVNANLQVGEEITVEDLLYVMLIPSANDAANALAEHVGGNIESFSSMMNTKARELGCTGSNFTNPSGLQEENHYTTTRDLLLISKEAISKNIIKKIIGTTTYTLPQTNKYNKADRIFNTTNYMKKKNLSNFYCDYCIGGKTGYTSSAKNCVVEFAEKDGIKLIAIVMGEDSNIKGKKFLDAKEMFEYVFKNYKMKNIANRDAEFETVIIDNATKATKELTVLYNKDVNILIKNTDEDNMEKNSEYFNKEAPIAQGETIGKVTFVYDGVEYTSELKANSNVEKSKTLEIILKIGIVIIIIFIILNLKKSNRNIRKSWKK